MKYWVQFLSESTGYIAGTIPPVFGKPQLIDACGDTAIFILDGRNSQKTMQRDAMRRAQRLEHWKHYKAYRIVSGPKLFQETKSTRIFSLTYPIHTS